MTKHINYNTGMHRLPLETGPRRERDLFFPFIALALLAIFALPSPPVSAQREYADIPIVADGKTVNISSNVYVIPDEARRGVPNVGIVVGSRAIEPPRLTNVRHLTLIVEARGYISKARQAALDETPEEFVLTDLQAARIRFDEIVGVRSAEDVLTTIFQRFCIGK